MATSDPTKIAEALARELSNIERINASTVKGLLDQENLMNKVAKAAANAKIPFNTITQNIGESVKSSRLFQTTQDEISELTSNKLIAERNLLKAMQQQIKANENLQELNKILNSTAAEKKALKKQELADLEAEYALGAITTEKYKEAKSEINTKFKSTRKLKEETERILQQSEYQNELSKEYLANLSAQISKRVTLNKVQSIGTEVLGQMGDLGKHISELSFPDWTDVLKKGVTNFLEYDKAAFGLRKSMGLLRGDFDVLQNNVKTVGIELQDLGVSFEQVAASTSAIANEFNMFVASSKELVSDVSVISAQLGIAETDSVKFLKTMSSVGNTTVASQKGMMGFAKEMSNAAGVPLPAVMKDVAEASDDVRIFTGRSADNLVKSAIQARQMGTTLQNMANSAKKMLDFQTSIADEMEASVLLGRDVNFQQARNLAYRKDIVGANQEILNIAKKIDFDAIDPYQAEAFAKASGKSVQELQEMLQADKEMEYIRNNGTVEQKAQLKKMEQMKRMRAEEAKDVGKMAEQRLREQANQERINQLQNQFNKLMSELSGPVMDFVEPLMSVATKILPLIATYVKFLLPIIVPFKMLVSILTGLGELGEFLSSFGKVANIFGKIFQFAGGIGRVLGIVGKFAGVFSKFLGPIGLLINAFQFISSLMNRWEKTPKGFLGGLQAIGGALYDVFLKPFVDVWDWISSKFVGNSPSQLGLGILDGIKSVGGMLLDALTLPFRTAFNFVSGLFGGPKLPKMSDVVFGSKEETGGGTAAKGSDLGTIIAEGNKQVVAKLDELITLMSNGGIAVNIDGTKASMLLARAQKERGAFGAI
jgi:hypothetical protein